MSTISLKKSKKKDLTRHAAKRRRLKTVIQELMYRAARLIASGHRLKLRFSRHCTGYRAFDGVY